MSDVLFPFVNESLLDDVAEDEVEDSDYVSDDELMDFSKYTYVFEIQINGINPSRARDAFEKNMERYSKFTSILTKELNNFVDIYEVSDFIYEEVEVGGNYYSINKINKKENRTIHRYKNVNVYSSDVYFAGCKRGDFSSQGDSNRLYGFAYEQIIMLKFRIMKDHSFTNIPSFFRFFSKLFIILNESAKKIWPKSFVSEFKEINVFDILFYHKDIENFINRNNAILNKSIKLLKKITGKNLKNNLISYFSYYNRKPINDNLVKYFNKMKLSGKDFDYAIDTEEHLMKIQMGNIVNTTYTFDIEQIKKLTEETLYKETGVHGYKLKLHGFAYLKFYLKSLQEFKDIVDIFGDDCSSITIVVDDDFFENLSSKKVIKSGLTLHGREYKVINGADDIGIYGNLRIRVKKDDYSYNKYYLEGYGTKISVNYPRFAYEFIDENNQKKTKEARVSFCSPQF